MVKVNAYNIENNDSYPVLWHFFLKILNFCVVDQESVAYVGLIDSFNVNPLTLTPVDYFDVDGRHLGRAASSR